MRRQFERLEQGPDVGWERCSMARILYLLVYNSPPGLLLGAKKQSPEILQGYLHSASLPTFLRQSLLRLGSHDYQYEERGRPPNIRPTHPRRHSLLFITSTLLYYRGRSILCWENPGETKSTWKSTWDSIALAEVFTPAASLPIPLHSPLLVKCILRPQAHQALISVLKA